MSPIDNVNEEIMILFSLEQEFNKWLEVIIENRKSVEECNKDKEQLIGNELS